MQPKALIHSKIIKDLAKEFGFLECGIAKVRKLEEEESHLEEWLKRGYQGGMTYLTRNRDKRLDPALLVPGAKTLVVFLMNYYPEFSQEKSDGNPLIARYAYGKDYHLVIRDRLRELTEALEKKVGRINGRAFTDSAPIMERQWAVLAGLGWIGKNTLLLNKRHGSYFFIAEMIIDLECAPDAPITENHCGTCTACIDACPTQAILPGSILDASKCISYLTIEHKEPFPETFKGSTEGWAFGCDICQEVCPWNRFSKKHEEELFTPRGTFLDWDGQTWMNLSEEVFLEQFADSPLMRAGLLKMKENVKALKKDFESE